MIWQTKLHTLVYLHEVQPFRLAKLQKFCVLAIHRRIKLIYWEEVYRSINESLNKDIKSTNVFVYQSIYCLFLTLIEAAVPPLCVLELIKFPLLLKRTCNRS